MNITVQTLKNGKWESEVVTLGAEASAKIKAIQEASEREDAVARAKGKNKYGLCSAWCREEHDESNSFMCYPEDGTCSCGMYKHHVHCGHGYVTQVG